MHSCINGSSFQSLSYTGGWCKHTWLGQLRWGVVNLKPLGLPILVGIYQVILKVQLLCLLAHLKTSSTDYYREVGVGLWLQSEYLPK